MQGVDHRWTNTTTMKAGLVEAVLCLVIHPRVLNIQPCSPP